MHAKCFLFFVAKKQSTIEKGFELLKFIVNGFTTERIVISKIFFKHEIVLFGQTCSVEQVFEGQITAQVLKNLPSVKEICLLHNQRIIK